MIGRPHRWAWWVLSLALVATMAVADEQTIFITYGPEAATSEGDDNFNQSVFFSLPATSADTVYLRLFDADVGGRLDSPFGPLNTQVRYRLYGGTGAFTAPTVRGPFPSPSDLSAGTLLAEEVIGEDPFLDHKWYSFAAVTAANGETVNGRSYFRLVIEGLEGNDGNIFEIAVSTMDKRNVAPDGLEMFSYAPTVRLPSLDVHAELRFFVPEGTTEINAHNFDLASANVGIDTKFRSGLTVTPSQQDQWARDTVQLFDYEAGRMVALTFDGGYEIPNDATFYFTDANDSALRVILPILTSAPNNRPTARARLNPLSQCLTIVFDGSASSDPDGDELRYFWDFGDGNTAEGSRVVHEYGAAGLYQAQLVVEDQSGHVGNAGIEIVDVLVNEPPTAVPGSDRKTFPGEAVVFDGRGSFDTDGQVARYVWQFGDGSRAEGATVSHVYQNPGNYTVSLRVEDDSDSPCNSGTAELEVWVNASPVVDLGEDRIISPNQEITLSGANSYDSDGVISLFAWDFGDGSGGEGIEVVHAYDTPGRYTVRLTITDDTDVANNLATDNITIVVNDPPDAYVDATPTIIAANEPVRFSGARSVDRDGQLIEYVWDFGDGNGARGSVVDHAFAQPGVYTAELMVRDNSTTSSDTDRATVQIIVNEPPVADAGPDQSVTSSTVQFDGSNSSDADGELIEYMWQFGEGSVGYGINPVHVYGNPGVYLVTLTVTDNSGTNSSSHSDDMVVTVNNTPVADAGPTLQGMPGEELTFDGGLSTDPDGEIAEYTWHFGDGESASGEVVTHRYDRPGTYAVTLRVRDDSGHDSAVSHDGTVVVINAPPVAIAGPDIVAAPGDIVVLNGRASYDPDGTLATVQWDFSDGQAGVAEPVARRTFDEPGMYTATLTVVDDSGVRNAQATDQVVIRINTRPTADPGDDILTCAQTLEFDGSASLDADGDPLVCIWDFGDGSPPVEGFKVRHTYDTAGVYPVILTVNDGTGLTNASHSKSIMVSINQAPMADAGDDITVCAGEVVLFSGGESIDPEGGLLRFHWDFGDGTTDVGVNPTKKYTEGGVYTVVLTVSDDSGLPCNTDQDVIVVRVADSPVAVAGEDLSVCANTEVRFDGTASTDFDGLVNRYFWDFGDGGTENGQTPTHKFREPGEYIVTLTITGDQVGDCDNTDSDEIVVTVFDAPVARFEMASEAPVGAPVRFDASESSGGGANIELYEWQFGDGGTASGEVVEYTYTGEGRFQVTLTITTDAETSCASAINRDLILVNAPPVANAGPDQFVGLNDVVVFDGSGSTDPDGSISQFDWEFGDGSLAEGVLARHVYTAPGRYTVNLLVGDNTTLPNRNDEDQLTVTVNATPQPVIDAPQWVCAGDQIRFSGLASVDPDGEVRGFEWVFGNGDTANGPEVTYSYPVPGRYTVTLFVDDSTGVANSRAATSMPLQVNHVPVPVAGPDRLACAGDPIDFDGSASYDRDGSIVQYTWDFGGGATADGEVVRQWFDTPGRYNVVLTVADDSGVPCGVARDTVVVRVNATPLADAGGDREAFVGGAHDAILFDGTASSDPDGDPLTYRWDFGDGSFGEGPQVQHAYGREGVYTVRLTVRDGTALPCGEAWDEVTVLVRPHEVAER